MSLVLVLDLVGWLGAALLLLAYGLVSSGRLAPGGRRFQLLNLAGAASLGLNGAYHGAWPSVGLNSVWLVIGVAALLRARRPQVPAVVPVGPTGT